jgi:putative sterol carrier protein
LAMREEIIAALEKVRGKFSEEKIKKDFANFSRTFEYVFKDLGNSFHIVIKNGIPGDLQNIPAEKPDIQLLMDSQTFLEIMDGKTNGMKAYSSGKLKIKASVTDMIKLQKLM